MPPIETGARPGCAHESLLETLQQPRLNALEEVNIGKLPHLFNVDSLDDFLVIEKYPANLIRQLLANERDVVSVNRIRRLGFSRVQWNDVTYPA